MVAEKDIIVALELATTSIRAIAGQRMPDGTMQVLAFAEENASNCIRKGIIDNIDKTTQAIARVLGQVGLQLGQTISRIYVGLSGQSLHSVQNHIQRTFAEKTQITNAMVDQLMDTNRGVVYTDSQILEVIPQEYKVGNRTEADIVGMQVEQMEANFLNVIARNSLAENIEKCVNGAGFEVAELLITPLTLGDTILSAAEKRSGCALVDIGADTTTVSIYTKNILRKLVVIPLGGTNVTMDIANCLTTEAEEAESLKLKYGRAWLEDHDTAQNNIIKISHDREISESRLCEIAEARYEEILRNIWAQIEDDSDKLTSGIVFTGGGAQMRFLADAFINITNSSKQIRIVKGLPADICTTAGVFIPDNGRANSILSMLTHGDQNCIILAPATASSNEDVPATNSGATATQQITAPVEQEEEVTVTAEQESANEEEVAKKKKSFWQILKDALTDDEDERN
jgi:cell division protein FtsA